MKHLPDAPGIYDLVCDLNGVRYTLSIPEAYPLEQSPALVVALHQGGVISPFYGREMMEYLVEPGLHVLEALIAAPECRFSSWTTLRCENDVLSLIDYLAENYPLDAKRIVLTGYSAGGAGVWYMAARRQERFSAAIPISCNPHADAFFFEWQVPVYAIHSRKDELVPYQQVEYNIQRLRDRGQQIEFVLLDTPTHDEWQSFVTPLQAAVPWIRQQWQIQHGSPTDML